MLCYHDASNIPPHITAATISIVETIPGMPYAFNVLSLHANIVSLRLPVDTTQRCAQHSSSSSPCFVPTSLHPPTPHQLSHHSSPTHFITLVYRLQLHSAPFPAYLCQWVHSPSFTTLTPPASICFTSTFLPTVVPLLRRQSQRLSGLH